MGDGVDLARRGGRDGCFQDVDPRLGPALLDALESGATPQQALAELAQGHDHLEYRQLTVLGPDGHAAAHSGAGSLGVYHHVIRPGVVAAGNMLSSADIIDAVVAAFESSSGDLEIRLLERSRLAWRPAVRRAQVHSAGLSVVRQVAWHETDLRVDWSQQPLAELLQLVELWLPERAAYVTRALNPSAAPAYGVPGDER